MKQIKVTEYGSLGPSGGTGGQEFLDQPIPKDSKVIEVKVRSGSLIDAVQIVYESRNGRHELPKHGGDGGQLNVFPLDQNEYITGLSGRFGSQVDSIRIHTNLQTSPVYGGAGGVAEYHYYAPENTEIIGFYGRSGSLIDAIGVVLRQRVS